MTENRPEGRLELTWTNKHRRLLAHSDSSYEWVDPSDYRVAEVRLLHDVTAVGETSPDRRRARDNLLIRGDALSALTSLVELPEFAHEYAGKVRLVYIDPPFNTGQAFKDYDDGLEHSVWLTMLRDRLEQIRALLSSSGSVWVHLDDVEVHRARCVLDEVFGPSNFVATVIWESSDSPRMDADFFSVRHNSILVYGKSRETLSFNRFQTDFSDLPEHYNRVDDEGVPYYLKPLRAMGGQGDTRRARPNLYYPLTAPDGSEVYPVKSDGTDGAWRWSAEKVAAEADRIEWVEGRSGWNPYYRVYPNHEGRPPETIWTHKEVGSNRTSKAEIKALFPDLPAFDTPKPERLMQRIIHIATDPGDIVVDCFLGSGTTAAVAHKMGRRWVGIEWEPSTVANFALPRLTMVVNGGDPGGITAAVGWSGGGGFRVMDVAPSMFDADRGRVYLADWAVNSALAEATAAQLGYRYEVRPPFCGRRGRTRLAVVDGLVNADVARVLVGALDEDERVVVCGTSVDPAARAVLRELRPGSTLRKIPSSILDEYRLRRRSDLRDLLDWDDAVVAMDSPADAGIPS